MTVAKLNFKYQEVDPIDFYRPGIRIVDLALGNDGKPMIWEDIAFQKWRDQGNNPESAVGTVQPPKETYIYISSGEIKVDALGIPKYIHELDYQGPMGKLGKWLSLAENFRQDLLNMMYDERGEQRPEMVEYISFLKSKGLKPEEVVA